MGNVLKSSKKNNQVAPQQGVFYPPSYRQPVVLQQPAQYGPPVVLQQPAQYGPPVMQMQQRIPARYLPSNQDTYLSNVTGLPPTDVGRLRIEFYNYANPYGEIDHTAFQKLYVASLLNMTWDDIGRDAELAFRNFDVNSTGGIDFNEYITACSRLSRGAYRPPTYQY